MKWLSMNLLSRSACLALGLMICGGVSCCQVMAQAPAKSASGQPIITQRTPNRARRAAFKLSPIQAVGQQDGPVVSGVPNPVPDGFQNRNGQGTQAFPAPIGCNFNSEQIHGALKLPNRGPKDEYLIDGADRNHRVYVDENWKVHGLDTEDTIGHFDTLDGRRVASPSNRVAIYAPRFATVRQISDINGRSSTARLATANKKTQTSVTNIEDITSSALQNLQPQRHRTTQRPLAFLDQTRGLMNDTILHMADLRAGFSAYENIEFIKTGRANLSESTRLKVALLSAQNWTDNLRVLVDSKIINLIMVNDVASAQELKISETKGSNPTLRVAKIASRITAQPGDTVDFTIRFDNVGNQTIGNVTIIDSLTGRLEYVEGSAECSLDGKLVQKENEAGSLNLRWEIDKPLRVGKGGIIRFTCRVR